MAETERTTKKHAPPKGGRKGGTLFPKISLKEALEYSKKLVAKTHTGPQPAQTLLPGVFGSATTPGKVRASALKQFGLLEGETDAYQATKLAKDIDAAPEDDRAPLVQRALLHSKTFKQIFDTFHGDTVSKAKVRQVAQQMDVHPDSADECTEIFTDSAVAAGLAKLEGDSLTLASAEMVTVAAPEAPESEVATPAQRPEGGGAPPGAPETAAAAGLSTKGARAKPQGAAEEGAEGPVRRSNKAGVTVNLNVDSSSDPDKLQKQLELLRKYGVI